MVGWDWHLAVGTVPHAGAVSQVLGEGQSWVCSQEDGDAKFPKSGEGLSCMVVSVRLKVS